MKNLKHQIKNQDGFTIIETMIVLAIAALILVIVFLAVPALQRSSRNSSRDNDAAKIAASVNECLSNNNGTLANCIANAGTATAPNQCAGGCAANKVTGNAGTLGMGSVSQLTAVTINAAGIAAFPASGPTFSTTAAGVYPGTVCTAGTPATVGAGANQFVVIYQKESSNSSNPINICLAS